MTLEEIGALCDAAEKRGQDRFNLTLPRTSHKREVRVAEGLYGRNCGLTLTEDTVVLVECREVRRFLKRAGTKLGQKLAGDLRKTMDRDSEGGNR